MKSKVKDNKILDKIVEVLFESGFMVLSFIFLVILLSSILFVFHISITKINIILVLVIMGIGYFIKIYKSKKIYLLFSILLSIILVFFSIYICSHTYDLSYDGNTYHKFAIGSLADGYNPVYEKVDEFIASDKSRIHLIIKKFVWVESYPKASWIFTANMYKYTNNIESAKILNMLIIYVTFCFSLAFFFRKINIIFSFILAFLIAINPVSVVQVFTNYVDGLMGLLLYIVICSLLFLSENRLENHKFNKQVWLILAMCIIICINLKFTGLVYVGLFCIMFFLIWMYEAIRDNDFWIRFRNGMIYYFVVVFISLFVVGISPYVTNTINYHNPLYPLIGSNKIDIMTHNSPVGFPERGALDKFFTSMYSEPANYKANTSDKVPKLRLPFKTNKREIKLYTSVDLRISGFGVLFSGIFTISLIIILCYIIKYFKEKNYVYLRYIISYLLLSFILIIIIDGSWWARYSPYIYLLPILALYLLLHDRNIYKTIISIMLIVLIAANNGLIGYVNLKTILEGYVKENRALIKMKKISDEQGYVNVALRVDEFNSIFYNFEDKDIVYVYCNKEDLTKPSQVYYFYYQK